MEDAEDGLSEMSSCSPLHLEFGWVLIDADIKVYNVDNDWKVTKNIRARSLRWTITDTYLLPNQRFLVYSSISPIVHIVNIGSTMTKFVANVTERHEGLDFSGHDGEEEDDYSFGIFSVKFSTELLFTLRQSNVNAVCFADEAGHVLYSGSDGHLCKVWDRRCLGTRGVESGVLRIRFLPPVPPLPCSVADVAVCGSSPGLVGVSAAAVLGILGLFGWFSF
ncbi:hypothetical protein LXL04_007888 [Taraxacum kok-saghyz]